VSGSGISWAVCKSAPRSTHTCNHASTPLSFFTGRVHPACKKTEWWGAGVVICLEHGADLHMALPLIVSCFSKIQIGFTFLAPAHLGSPGKRTVKWVCVCVCSRLSWPMSASQRTLKAYRVVNSKVAKSYHADCSASLEYFQLDQTLSSQTDICVELHRFH